MGSALGLGLGFGFGFGFGFGLGFGLGDVVLPGQRQAARTGRPRLEQLPLEHALCAAQRSQVDAAHVIELPAARRAAVDVETLTQYGRRVVAACGGARACRVGSALRGREG